MASLEKVVDTTNIAPPSRASQLSLWRFLTRVPEMFCVRIQSAEAEQLCGANRCSMAESSPLCAFASFPEPEPEQEHDLKSFALIYRDVRGRNHWLQDEVTRLHGKNEQLSENLSMANQQEEELKQQIVALTAKIEKHEIRNNSIHPEEMETLIQTMSVHVREIEEELSRCVKERSEVVEPFLKSANNTLMRICIACQKVNAATHNEQELPPLGDPESQDIRKQFMRILGELQYVLGVIDPTVSTC